MEVKYNFTIIKDKQNKTIKPRLNNEEFYIFVVEYFFSGMLSVLITMFHSASILSDISI